MREKGRAAVYTMAGVYLLVMAYNLWDKLPQSGASESLMMAVFAIVFVVAGLGMAGFGLFLMHAFYKRAKKKAEPASAESLTPTGPLNDTKV